MIDMYPRQNFSQNSIYPSGNIPKIFRPPTVNFDLLCSVLRYLKVIPDTDLETYFVDYFPSRFSISRANLFLGTCLIADFELVDLATEVIGSSALKLKLALRRLEIPSLTPLSMFWALETSFLTRSGLIFNIAPTIPEPPLLSQNCCFKTLTDKRLNIITLVSNSLENSFEIKFILFELFKLRPALFSYILLFLSFSTHFLNMDQELKCVPIFRLQMFLICMSASAFYGVYYYKIYFGSLKPPYFNPNRFYNALALCI